jgi:hypothetical protein
MIKNPQIVVNKNGTGGGGLLMSKLFLALTKKTSIDKKREVAKYPTNLTMY